MSHMALFYHENKILKSAYKKIGTLIQGAN